MPYDDEGAAAQPTSPKDIRYAVALLRGWMGERRPQEDQAAALR